MKASSKRVRVYPSPFRTIGRVDKNEERACPVQGRLPDATQGAEHLRQVFYRMGFDDREIVALSGLFLLFEFDC